MPKKHLNIEVCYRNNTDSLFRKYAGLVTSFARLGIGKDYLSIPHSSDVTLLLPNGFHEHSSNSHRATFSSRAIYSPKLIPALMVIDSLVGWITNFNEAQRILLWHLGLRREIPALAKSVMFAQSIFNPDADPESTSVDGRVGRTGTNITWADVRDGAGVTAQDSPTSSDSPQIIAGDSNDRYNELWRYFALFDTSSLPDNATIDNTTKFSFYITVNTDQLTQSFRWVTSTPASNTALATGDYGNIATVAQAADVSFGSLSTSAYNDFTLNATGRGNVSLTGVTKFGARCDGDTDDSEPTWGSDQVSRITAQHAGAANEPRLVVDYTELETTVDADKPSRNEAVVDTRPFNKPVVDVLPSNEPVVDTKSKMK